MQKQMRATSANVRFWQKADIGLCTAHLGRMGIGRMIERAGEAVALPFPVHAHMLRHSTGYALAGKGMDTRRLQHFLGHASITNTVRYTAMSPEPFKDIWR